MTLAAAKKKDPVMFEKGTRITRDLQETGMDLAVRALKWGTFYAVSGCSLVAFGVWTLSGASNVSSSRCDILYTRLISTVFDEPCDLFTILTWYLVTM